MIRAGPVGRKRFCPGEVEWDEKGRTMFSLIYVTFNELITSVQFGYLENGAVKLSAKYGLSEGHNFRAVRLNQDEYVTGLSAVLGQVRGIRHLTFHTNHGKHGPFGSSDLNYPNGSKIEIDPAICDRREFGGFFGSYNGSNLSSIGIYVNPIAVSHTVVKLENI